MKFFIVIFFGPLALVALGESKAFGPLTDRSGPGEILNQAVDVFNGDRDLKVNLADGTISTGWTDQEIMSMIAIGAGVLLGLVACCACLKCCCCPSKPPTVIMYQQMPNPQSHNRSGTAAVIPMETSRGLPPPYPGLHA